MPNSKSDKAMTNTTGVYATGSVLQTQSDHETASAILGAFDGMMESLAEYLEANSYAKPYYAPTCDGSSQAR